MANTSNNNSSNDIILQIDVNYNDAIKKIARYSQEIDSLRDQNKSFKAENKELINQNKELEKQYKSGQISLQQYNQQLRLNNDAIEANNEAVEANNIAIQQRSAQMRTVRSEIQSNIQQEKLEATSLKALTARLKEMNAEWELMGEGDARDKLGVDISNIQSQINSLNESRGRIGSFRESILSAVGANNTFSQSILSLAQNSQTDQTSLKSFFSNVGTEVQAFGKTLMGLMANPVFLAIAGIAGAGVVFKFWYDYNKGLVEATKLTKQFTGLAGNDLKSFRNEVQGIADTFGKDFKETLEAVNVVSKQFGISQQEAMQYVKDGFVAGADNNGEYLETLKEYSASFKQAGMSASEFIATIADVNKDGIFSDKAVDSIKEADIRIRQMSTATASALDGIGISSKQVQEDLKNGSKTTFDVMKQVSAQLDKFPDQSKQVGTAIADVFGGAGEDAGLQYIKTLKDIDTNLDSVKAQTGQLGELQEQQMNANIELQNVVSALFDQTGGTFESMIANAKVFATQSLTAVIKGLIDVANWCISIYNNSLLIRAVINMIMGGFKNMWVLLKGFFTYVIDTAQMAGKILYSALTLDFDGLQKSYSEWGNRTTDLFENTFKEIAKNSEDAIKEILDPQKIDPIEIPIKVENETTDTTSSKNKPNVKATTDAMKKASDAEKKASVELAKFRLETEIKKQKDLADNQKKGEEERIKALKSYYTLQKSYIKLEEASQLKEANLTASQKQLITEKANKKQADLEKELSEQTIKITTETEAKRIDVLKTDLNNRLATIKQGSTQELSMRLDLLSIQRDEEIKNATKTGADVLAIKAKYLKLENEERQKQTDYLNNQQQKVYQNQILQAQMNNQNTLALQILAKQEELEALKQIEGESDTDFLNRRLVIQEQLLQLDKDYKAHQLELRTQSMQAISAIAGSFSELFETIGEENEALMALSKATALAEIGFAQATAIAKGIASAQSVPFPANIGAIATTIGAILSSFTQVHKIFKSTSSSSSKKYATGGLVTGDGSGTSDSIHAMLSNGESVLNARSTAMFAPILSEFNQIGGGVAIQSQESSNQITGEDMLARSFAKALVNMPSPNVSVQEINNVNTRVSVLEKTTIL